MKPSASGSGASIAGKKEVTKMRGYELSSFGTLPAVTFKRVDNGKLVVWVYQSLEVAERVANDLRENENLTEVEVLNAVMNDGDHYE